MSEEAAIFDPVWHPCPNSPTKWIFLQGYTCASVRLLPVLASAENVEH